MMAANEALREGYGGIARVSRACGLSRLTIAKGMRELGAGAGRVVRHEKARKFGPAASQLSAAGRGGFRFASATRRR